MNLGKRVESNVGRSLKMAGVSASQDFRQDLHDKVDYLLDSIDGHPIPGGVAIQVSMKDDLVKARVAKLLALRKFRYFIYLLVRDVRIFRTPSSRHGEDLKKLLLNLLPVLKSHRALAVEIGKTVSVVPL